MCTPCNQYFGSKVEQKTLSSYPFNLIRVTNGVITKKKKWAELNNYRGVIRASPVRGLLGFNAVSDQVHDAVLQGKISQFRIIAEIVEPLAVCRLLIKIGLESVAYHSLNDALHERFDKAREFARAPRKGTKWWFLMHTDVEALRTYRFDISMSDHSDRCSISVEVVEDGAEILALELHQYTFFAPLSERLVASDLDKLPQPEYRFYRVGA